MQTKIITNKRQPDQVICVGDRVVVLREAVQRTGYAPRLFRNVQIGSHVNNIVRTNTGRGAAQFHVTARQDLFSTWPVSR
jgi:hypothetical protein